MNHSLFHRKQGESDMLIAPGEADGCCLLWCAVGWLAASGGASAQVLRGCPSLQASAHISSRFLCKKVSALGNCKVITLAHNIFGSLTIHSWETMCILQTHMHHLLQLHLAPWIPAHVSYCCQKLLFHQQCRSWRAPAHDKTDMTKQM